MGGSDFSTDLDSGRRPESRSCERSQPPNLVRSEQSWTSPASSRRGDAREDAANYPCLTCRTLLPTILADTDATCSRRVTLRGEGTRRVTTIPEISPLAQSFPSVVRLQCPDLTRYLINTYALSLCRILIPSGWVSPRTIIVARFHVHINHCTALREWRCIGCDLARRLQRARGVVLLWWPGVLEHRGAAKQP